MFEARSYSQSVTVATVSACVDAIVRIVDSSARASGRFVAMVSILMLRLLLWVVSENRVL